MSSGEVGPAISPVGSSARHDRRVVSASRTVANSALLPGTGAPSAPVLGGISQLRYEDGEREYGNRVARRHHRALTEPASYEARPAVEMGWWRP